MESDETVKTLVKELLLSPVLSSLEFLLSYLTPPRGEDRDRVQAEVIFAYCRQHYPNALSLKLSDLLESSTEFNSTSLYATLLHGLLSRQSTNISPMILTELKPRIFTCFQQQRINPTNFRTLSKSISIVASRVFETEHGDWQELLDYIVSSVDSDDLNKLAFMVFSDLPMNMGRFLKPKFDSLYLAFLKCLSSPNMKIRILAYSASSLLVQQLAGFDVDYDNNGDLLPAMLKLLIDLIDDTNGLYIEEGLKDLVRLAAIDPSFFTKHLKQLCESMVQIAEVNDLWEGSRYAALEVIKAVNDSATKKMSAMMKNLHGEIVNRLISSSMDMLVRIEHDPAWYIMDANKGENARKNARKTRSYDLGICLLGVISSAVPGDLILPIALELIQEYLSLKGWRIRHAGIVTLAVIAERCSEVIVNYLGRVVTMISNSLHDLNPQVRWAAVSVVRMLSINLGPTLQVQYHHKMLPALTAMIADFHFPHLQERAALEIRLSSKDCIRNDLKPYLEEIVSKLLALLQNENQQLQEEAMATLASIAISSQDQFQLYYDATMASLKAIFFNESDASKLMLRAKSVKCISSIAVAVGKEKFMNDATKVIEVLVSIHQSSLETDHSMRIHLLQAWLGLCKCLGQSFVPYVRDLMPIFLWSAELSIGVNTDEPPHQSDILREKALACNLLFCCAVQFKEFFFIWVNQVAKILVPLLEFHPHFETKMVSVSAMPELLCSAILAIQKGESGGHSMSYVQKLVTLIVPALVKALKEEPEKEICARMLNSLNKCVEVSGFVFPEAHIGLVADGMKHVLAVHSFRNLEMAGREADEDFDMEEEENIKEPLEDILQQAGNCLITMIKVFKAEFMPYFEKLWSDITAMLGDDHTAREKTIAFSIINCVIQQCQEAAHKYYDTYLPFLLKACDDENSDVKQEAAHGIGVCAEFAQSKFKNIAEVAVVSLNSVISHSDELLSSENRKAYDTAVSALGKICKFHRESINAPQVIPTWLSYLPIEDDPTEAKVVHEQLCSMVERSDKELLGPNNLHIPKITEVFAKVVAEGDNLATAETAGRMVVLLRQFEKLQLL